MSFFATLTFVLSLQALILSSAQLGGGKGGKGRRGGREEGNQSPSLSDENRKLLQEPSPGLVDALLTASSEVARNQLLNPRDYKFDFFNFNPKITGNGGTVTVGNRANFPAITTQGVAMAVGILYPCGLNTPHFHPRASEILFVANGTGPVLSGTVLESGADNLISNLLRPGQAEVYPKGSIHFQQNLGCDTVMFVSAFGDEDPGVSQIAQNFFGAHGDGQNVDGIGGSPFSDPGNEEFRNWLNNNGLDYNNNNGFNRNNGNSNDDYGTDDQNSNDVNIVFGNGNDRFGGRFGVGNRRENIGTDILLASLGVQSDINSLQEAGVIVVNTFREAIPRNVAVGLKQCYKRCNIPFPSYPTQAPSYPSQSPSVWSWSPNAPTPSPTA